MEEEEEDAGERRIRRRKRRRKRSGKWPRIMGLFTGNATIKSKRLYGGARGEE